MKSARPARDRAPEALFAIFLEGLRELHACGGMHAVLQLALAARETGRHGSRPDGYPRLDRSRAAPSADAADDELFEALVAALEQAFFSGGLDAVLRELAAMGGVVEDAARKTALSGERAIAPPTDADAARRAWRFAQAAFRKSSPTRAH